MLERLWSSFPLRGATSGPIDQEMVWAVSCWGSSVWADVARHTTTGKFREGELGEVDSRALTSTVAAVFVDPLVVQSEELQRIDKGRKTSI
jgi:hypothetical protein